MYVGIACCKLINLPYDVVVEPLLLLLLLVVMMRVKIACCLNKINLGLSHATFLMCKYPYQPP